MAEYFGKGCPHFVGQWEEEYINDVGHAECKEKYTPILVFCNHKENPDDREGNCNPKNCPLGRKI